jgi:PAS domain S-box-containing protein
LEPCSKVPLGVRYQTLLEQVPAVIFMGALEDGGTEACVSPHIEAVLGFTREEWLDDPVRWYFQIHPADRERWNAEAADFLLSGRPLRSAYRVLARDGHVVWLHCEAKLVRRPVGPPGAGGVNF